VPEGGGSGEEEMKVIRLFMAACLFAFGPAAASADELPQLRAAMLA